MNISNSSVKNKMSPWLPDVQYSLKVSLKLRTLEGYTLERKCHIADTMHIREV